MLRVIFILVILFSGTACISAQERQDLLNEDDRKFIDSLFQGFTGEVPGATVMISRGKDLLFCQGYGLANLDTQRAANCDTAYRVGSVSKQFTAMAILKLVDEGLLDLSDSIVDVLPGFPESRRKVTVFHLLTHQSGLPGYDPLTVDAEDMSITDADVVRYLQSINTSYFLPGTEYRYSNSAYATLAEIVATRASMSFSAFMQKEVFAPSKMSSTTLYADSAGSDVRALGYAFVEGEFVLDDQSPASAIQGDGSIYTTARDYYRWHIALIEDLLVASELQEEAYRPQKGTGGRYGFGWSLPERPPLNFVQHGGATAGFLSYTARIPESKITVAIFTNRGWGEAGSTVDLAVRAEALLSIASNGDHPMPPKESF